MDTHYNKEVWEQLQDLRRGPPALAMAALTPRLTAMREVIERDYTLALALDIVKEPLYFQAFRHSPYVSRIRGGVTGDLLIFPSWLLHRVNMSQSEEARISIAFNAIASWRE